MNTRWPIIVVTGANGGVGFGICHRLLLQLSHASPDDTIPQFTDVIETADLGDLSFEPCEGLTLVMACRSLGRAETARKELFRLLDKDLARRKAVGDYDAHAKQFRENLRIELQQLDLASMTTVFRAAQAISETYPYISHIVLNAGVASFSGIDWWIAAKQLLRNVVLAVTTPHYNIPNIGERSIDGLGWVWQCNVFGHYAFVRALQSRLEASARTSLGPARVLWMSSLEASPFAYNADDWQLIKAHENYALSKYQIDLIGTRLDADALASGRSDAPRHILVQPGVAATSIVNSYHTWFTVFWMNVFFWLVRWLGSPHHTIHAHTAGISASHAALIPLPLLDAYYSAYSHQPGYFKRSALPYRSSGALLRAIKADGKENGYAPKTIAPLRRAAVRLGSETDRRGRARVGLTEVREWSSYGKESAQLRDRMEALYQELRHDHEHPEERQIEGFVGMGGPINPTIGNSGDSSANKGVVP